MTKPPSGTVTFLFTDIEGSTRLAQEHPQAMPVLLARHHEILNHAIQSHNGYVFQRVGDSFAAAFHSASDALHAALEAQRELHNEPWTPAPIRVRMGIHTASAQINDAAAPTTYSGYANLALTQRIMSAGHGGQVLISGATWELVRDVLPTNTELVDLGKRRLKDLLRPEHLYQANGPGLPSTFPPLKTHDAFPNNLPVQLTSFIGREKEIEEIKRSLAEHRLVTLTGSGGTGKTRLSLHVAADLTDQFGDGIWFVELAPLADPERIPQTILSAIGISEQAGRLPLELLKDYLHERRSLIVFDNCEHLIDASAQIVHSLLGAAPGLKILASSREALRVQGELSYSVPSLSLPDTEDLPTVERLAHVESVRLFVERATLVLPHFQMDRENAGAIAQICRRLDGIPLAIELAAARVRVMSVEQISRRLDDRFRLLTGGARTALPRQQTLRALIDWSYDLLSEDERLLLCRLSVFAGGWTLGAAEQVCAGERIASYEVLDLLSQLTNKSLTAVGQAGQGSETRYRMLETIRQYARERLLEHGEGPEGRGRHLDYYLQGVKRAEQEFFGPRELTWLVWLESEWDNLRAAVEWSLETRPQAGLELVNCLGHFIMNNWFVSDMENWLSQLVPHPANAARTAARARGLVHWAMCVGIGTGRVDVESARAMVEEGLSIFESLGDKDGIAYGLLQKGYFFAWLGEPNRGIPFIEQALELFRETGSKYWIALSLFRLGFSLEAHSYARKLACMQESLSLFRELGNTTVTLEVLKQLGAAELRLGHFDAAHLWLDEALTILQKHGASLGSSKTVSYDLGDLAYYEGDYDLAQQYYEVSLSWADRIVSRVSIAYARVRLGYVYLRRGSADLAARFLQEALLAFQATGNSFGLTFALEGFASLAVAGQRWDQAARLFAYAEKQHEQVHGPRPPVEQAAVDRDLEVLRARLTDMEYAHVSREGRAMTLEQAMAIALGRI